MITKENLLKFKELHDKLEEYCTAFIDPEYNITLYEIDETHISIWSEDNHREPFTDYIRIPLEEFCNPEYYKSNLRKRQDKLEELTREKQKKERNKLEETETKERAELLRLKQKYGEK